MARVEAIAARIAEARRLREEAAGEASAIIGSALTTALPLRMDRTTGSCSAPPTSSQRLVCQCDGLDTGTPGALPQCSDGRFDLGEKHSGENQ